jgi:Terminase large subunit, T4likevirus-type, N-terminal
MTKPLREIAYKLDPVLWAREVLGMSPRPWQEQFLRVPHGQNVLVLTARQVGKTTVAACAMAHTAIYEPGSLSVVACPAQRQSAEPIRKVKEMVLKAGATLITDNKYGIELANGSRVLALPSSDESIRGLTVDGWIVADEAAYLTEDVIAALRPMRAQRPGARYVMLSTANTRTDPFWSAWETGGQSWMRIQVTVDVDASLYSQDYLDQERRALGNDRYKREFLGIPTGGQVSPFTWELFERATKTPVHPNSWELLKPTLIAHDVGHTKDRSTAVIGGTSYFAPELRLIKELHELPQGLFGSARAEALSRIDRLYDNKTLIFADVSYDPTYAESLLDRFGPERVIGLRITNSGDGMTPELRPVSKNRAIRIYPVGRSYLFDLLHRELHDNKVRFLDGPASRRAYEQLMALEMEYGQNGTVYKCHSGRHDDLAISCAMLVWAAQHPHLSRWCRPLEPQPPQNRRPAPTAAGWT